MSLLQSRTAVNPSLHGCIYPTVTQYGNEEVVQLKNSIVVNTVTLFPFWVCPTDLFSYLARSECYQDHPLVVAGAESFAGSRIGNDFRSCPKAPPITWIPPKSSRNYIYFSELPRASARVPLPLHFCRSLTYSTSWQSILFILLHWWFLVELRPQSENFFLMLLESCLFCWS